MESEILALADILNHFSISFHGCKSPHRTDRAVEPFSSKCGSSSPESAHNAVLPINQLPAEVLAHIFRMLSMPSHAFPATLASFPDLTDLLTAVHVCRHWRDVAVMFPDLWAVIDAVHPGLVDTTLIRSRAVPLRVALRDRVCESSIEPMLNNGDLLKQLGSLCGDIEELYIEPKYSYGHGLLTTFDRPAPLLRSLTIGRVSMYPDERLPQMFAGSMPKLERLTLRGYVRWPDNAFRDLTHLCLHDQVQHARPSLAEFLDFLDASPRLEQLVLVDAGPTVWNAQDADIVGGRVVSLPRLKCLDIGYWDSVRSVTEFLSHLDIPISAALSVWSRSCTVGGSGNVLKSILPPDLRRLGPLRSLTTMRVASHTHVQGFPGTRGIGNGDENLHVLSAHNGTLQLLGDFNVPEDFPTVLDRFDLTHVQTLTLSSGEALRLSESQWRRVLSSVPRLRTFTVVPEASDLLLALLDRSEHASPTARLLCPELGSITVMDGRESTIPLLVRFAAQRLRQGRPLEELCVVCDARSEIAALDRDAQMQLLGCVTEVEYKKRVADAVRVESPQWPSAAYIWARGASQVSV